MVMALLITAIIWNIGTWYLGIPCSSSHALIGSITGVSLAYIMLPGNHAITLSWTKVAEAGLSLIISPIIGFVLAMFFMYIFSKTVTNKAIYQGGAGQKGPTSLDPVYFNPFKHICQFLSWFKRRPEGCWTDDDHSDRHCTHEVFT